MFILYFLLQEIPKPAVSNTVLWYALITTIITTILAPIVVPWAKTYFKPTLLELHKSDVDIDRIEAETDKIKTENKVAILVQLVDITEKFKKAQEEYLIVKENLIDVKANLDSVTEELEQANIHLAGVKTTCNDMHNCLMELVGLIETDGNALVNHPKFLAIKNYLRGVAPGLVTP